MKNTNDKSAFTAGLIAKITNPTILSLLFLAIISWTSTANFWLWLEWIWLMLVFLVILPLVYVYLRFYLKRKPIEKRPDPTRILKYHPKDIIVLSLFFGLPCLMLLVFLETPSTVVYTLAALLVCSLLVAICNLFYRVSFHLASITVLIIMSVWIWDYYWLTSLAFIPLIGWSKYRLREHNVIQIISGMLLAAAISLSVLHVADRLS